MPDTYTQFFYHFIWATRDRQPFITPEVEAPLYRFIRARCGELGVFVHALDGIEDHIHLVASVPPRLAVAQVLHDLKGASSRLINGLPDPDFRLYWQTGYGGLTFARKDLARVVEYVRNQKQHHRDGRLSAEMERCEE
jgi:putative transposase